MKSVLLSTAVVAFGLSMSACSSMSSFNFDNVQFDDGVWAQEETVVVAAAAVAATGWAIWELSNRTDNSINMSSSANTEVCGEGELSEYGQNWMSTESDGYTGETTYKFYDGTWCTVSNEDWVENPSSFLYGVVGNYNTERKAFEVGAALAADKILNNKNAHYETVNKLTNACFAYYEEERGQIRTYDSMTSFCQAYLAGARTFEKELMNTNGDIEQAFSNAKAASFFVSDELF